VTTAPKKAPAPSLFPIFLKLEGQPCLVVGAGDVAESKITGLLEAAAKVRVVAPEATTRAVMGRRRPNRMARASL